MLAQGEGQRIGAVMAAAVGLYFLVGALAPANAAAQGEEDASAPAQPEFGGPTSTQSQLAQLHDGVPDPQYRLPSMHELWPGWGSFNDDLLERYHLALSLDYSVMGAVISESLGDVGASSSVLRFFGAWTLVDPGGHFQGSFVFKIELRTAFTSVAPRSLGNEAGVRGTTAVSFNDAGFIVTNLYWQQQFLDQTVQVAAGQLTPTDYFDTYGLVHSFTSFQNRALEYATVPLPKPGLGLVLVTEVFDHYYAVAAIQDANADPGDLGMDSWETFKTLELGYFGSMELRFIENVHVTLWQVDERVAAGIPGDWGLRFSASWLFGGMWSPFARAGWTHGTSAIAEADGTLGIGLLMPTRDLLALGLNVAKIQGSLYGPQYTAELFYRLQLSKSWALTADLQLVGNPADNPNANLVVLGGLRLRVQI